MQLEHLARARWKVAGALTIVMVAAYAGFIFLVAFGKESMTSQITPGLSVGIALGAGLIALAWGLTAFYSRWAGKTYDAGVRKLRKGQ